MFVYEYREGVGQEFSNRNPNINIRILNKISNDVRVIKNKQIGILHILFYKSTTSEKQLLKLRGLGPKAKRQILKHLANLTNTIMFLPQQVGKELNKHWR
jgi:hypothetical protein